MVDKRNNMIDIMLDGPHNVGSGIPSTHSQSSLPGPSVFTQQRKLTIIELMSHPYMT